MPWRDASVVGILMNTRGLMELIVLNVGLDLGVLSPRLFTMLVIMALVTTCMTAPLLGWTLRRPGAPPAPAPGPGALVCVSDPAIVPLLIDVARRLGGVEARLVALHVVRSDRPSAYLGEGPDPHERLPLDVAVERGAALGVVVEPVSVIADDPARDIVRVAALRASALVLLGSHRPLLGEGQLAGVAGRVLAEAEMDVAVLLDRGLADLVSYHAPAASEPALDAAVARLAASGLRAVPAPGPGVLLVAPVGTVVPDGQTALLVRRRPPA